MLNYMIILLLIIIILLDFKTTKVIEGYTHFTDSSWSNQNTYSSNAGINIKPNNQARLTHFKNFGIIGKTPPIPVSDSCHLEFNCAGYPYNVDEKNVNVCQRCSPNSINKNYNQLDRPLYVMSRGNGRPRQRRRIL